MLPNHFNLWLYVNFIVRLQLHHLMKVLHWLLLHLPMVQLDANKPPDYNDALKYRKAMGEGYPEPSLVDDGYPEPALVDQPPSYELIETFIIAVKII